MKQVCIVTAAHICDNPRALKEADALNAAGYDVRVVAMDVEESKSKFDKQLMASRKWKLETVKARRGGVGHRVWLKAALRQKLFLAMKPLQVFDGCLSRAYARFASERTALAGRERAGLFLAHTPQALPSAAAAAKKWNARLGFDAEDFHRGEFHNSKSTAELQALTEQVEKRYLPRCHYLTASSGGIAKAYAELLGIPAPRTVLNVFPRRERLKKISTAELAAEKRGDGLSLYWCSQTIGPDRGLEDVLRALAILKPLARLRVRGAWAAGYEQKFMELARSLNIADSVRVLAPAPPDELVARASCHDVCLALEPGDRVNSQLAASNKLFVGLLAGLAVAATDTSGQREILSQIPEVGFLYRPGDFESLARGIQSWLDAPEKLQRAKAAALEAANHRFCWEIESQKFLAGVAEVLK